MTFTVNLNIEDCPVTVEFEWTGQDEDGGPNWETMQVLAFLPNVGASGGSYWVRINDLLSDEQWVKIEHAIQDNWKDIQRQALKQEC